MSQTRWPNKPRGACKQLICYLIDSARWYREEGHDVQRTDPSGIASVSAALGARATAVEQVREVIIMDANGDPLYPLTRHGKPQSQRLRPVLFHCATGPSGCAGLFISEPLTTRSEGPPRHHPVPQA